jgi:transforming growth factor-beta-induced protein
MKIRLARTIAALLALTLVAAACGDDDDSSDEAATETTVEQSTTEDEMAEDEAMAEESGTIVEVAVADGNFTTLVAAADAAGLVETLSGEGPFTVFAPTDAAFAAALEDLDLTAEELLADTELLTSVLTYHVVPAEVPSSEVVTLDGQSVATVNGAELTITVDGETVMVDDATVIAVDVEASNGVIHVIDSVLLPPS